MASTGSEIASAYVAITVKAPDIKKQIEQQLGKASSGSEKTGTEIGSKISAGLSKAIKVGAAGVAGVLGTALVKGFGRLKAIETAQAKMRGLGYDSETVSKAMDNALASVKGTAFGLGDAATVAGQLMAANIKPGKELEGVLTAVGNNAAAAGISFDEMGSIFAKAATQANGVQNDVISQLADRGIPIYQALGDQLGVTAGEVFKLASEGKISFETFQAAATAAAGTVADEMGNTTTGAFDNMMAALGRLGAKILEDVFPLIGPLFQDITKWLDVAAQHVEPIVTEIGTELKQALESVQAAWQWLKDNADWLGPLAVAVGTATTAVVAFNEASKAVAAVQAAGGIAKWTSATKIGTAAQAAFNAVMNANPIMLIITAVAALVAGLVYFFTQTETGKKVWAEFTRFLGEAWANISGFFTAAYENVILPVFNGIKTAVQAVGDFFVAAWQGYIKPVFDGIAATATWVFQNILLPAFQLVQFAFAVLGGIFQGIWDFILKPVFDAIGAVFEWIYREVIQPVVLGIKIYIQIWINIIKWLWENAIKPVFDAIGAAFNWIYRNVIQPVVVGIKAYIQVWINIITWLWVNVIQPVFAKIGEIFNWVWLNVIQPVVSWIQQKIQVLGLAFEIMRDTIRQVWDNVSNKIKSVWEAIKLVIDTMVKVVQTDPKKAFEAARDAIGDAWSKIQDLAKKPVKFVIETVINGLIGTVNKILPDGAKIPEVKLPKGFSDGGYTGNIAPTAVAGVVHGNEHVIRARSRFKIERHHPGVLDHMNKFGEIPGYSRGGLVNPLPKGSYSVSQPYHAGHNGIDLAAAAGTRVYAAGDGVVGLAGSVNMGGNEVYVQHTNGLGTRYSHLSRFATSVGTPVKAGNVIGYVGSTGMSTGPHLHYMVHSPGGGGGNYGNHVNPAPYLGLFGKDLGEAGGAASILDGLVDWAVSKVKDAFPGGGMWIDVAAGLAKNAAQMMAKAFNPFAGSDGHTMLYDNGGWLPTGKSLVENKSGRPEPILTAAQWDDLLGSRGGGDVYVQNPFTGEYLLSQVDARADAAVDRGLEDQAAADRLAAHV